MKKLAVLAVLLSLGIGFVGCEQKKKTDTPAAPPATDAAPPAEPAK